MKYHIFLKNGSTYKEQQILLWKDNLKNIPENRFNWFYDENPYEPPLTVLAKTDQDELVGSCSLYVRDIAFQQDKQRVGIASDFAVSARHRVFGPALKMQRLLVDEAQKHNFSFLFAFPNNNSRALFERVGYKKLAAISSAVKILKSAPRLSAKISFKAFSTALGFFIDRIFILYENILHLFYGASCSVQTGFAPPADYDALWDKAGPSFPLIGEKSSAYLKWRYLNNPARGYRFFNAYDKQGELKGFIVFSVNDDLVILEELFVALNDKKSAAFLISAFVKFVRQHNYGQIHLDYLGDEWILKIFRKFLFFIIPGDRYCLLLPIKNGESYEKLLFNSGNWFLFESEMDI